MERERGIVKKSGGKRCEYQAMHQFGSSTRLQLCDKRCTDALLRREVIVLVTIHDKMFALWKKGSSWWAIKRGSMSQIWNEMPQILHKDTRTSGN